MVGDGDRVLVVCAELVVRIFGEVPALVGLGECGQAEAGPQQQEDDPFHGYLLISKCTSVVSVLQDTVLDWPGSMAKKLSLQ